MTSIFGIDLLSLTLVGTTWFTAADGSWALPTEGIGADFATHNLNLGVIPAGADNLNLSVLYQTSLPASYQAALTTSTAQGQSLSIRTMQTYRAPTAWQASTQGRDGPNDAGAQVELLMNDPRPSGQSGFLLDAGPPERRFIYGSPYAYARNPLAVPVTIQSVTYIVDLWVAIQTVVPPASVPPPSPTQPPSGVSPIAVNPVSSVTRRRLEANNPGYTVRWTRQERFPDFGQITLGQRGQLTVPFAGFVARGHLVTGVELHVTADQDPIAERSQAIYTLEKIPGTILPGAGTSTSGQDAAGTGAEVSAYLLVDDGSQGTGIGLSGLS